ncbi:MAG: transposase [Synergistales bacterium]|nr:transposase [Synergistales bacterium]
MSGEARYSDAFRKDAVSLVLDHWYTCKDAAERLGVPKSTMTNWARKQRNGNNGNTRSQRQRDLEAQVRKLEKQLENAEKECEIVAEAADLFARKCHEITCVR